MSAPKADPRIARLTLLTYYQQNGGGDVQINFQWLKAQCRRDAASLAREAVEPVIEERAV